MKDFTFCVGGPAGKGIKTVGFNFGQVMLHHGYFVHDNDEYPSLIKGGHNVLWARAADEKIYCHDGKTHLLLALDKKTVLNHQDSIEAGGVIIFDEKMVKLKDEDKTRDDISYIPLPLLQTAVEVGGKEIMFNTVGLGAALALMGADIEIYKEVLKNQFEDKGDEIVKGNQDVAQAGFDLGTEKKPELDWSFTAQERSNDQAYLLTGNQAITYGAANAGCKILCSYPMTPASAVMEFFGQLEESHNVVLKHTEDEVAALNMAIGAWHTGSRVMVATSGGGFALMVEALGFAGITEAGPVIFIAQRPGPGTGVPTYTGQGDVRFAMHAGQDEFPRVVLAPGDTEECFNLGHEAFNLGDSYQVPVIILSDKFLAESHFTTPEIDDQKLKIEKGKVVFEDQTESFQRYDVNAENGISARTIPGVKGGEFLANSYDHDEHGYAAEESEMRINQVNKRHQKQLKLQQDLPMPKFYGEENAELTIVCWGSTKMVALEAMRQLVADGKSVNVLHFSYLYPLNWEAVQKTLDSCKKTIFVEGNLEGLYEGVLKQYCSFTPSDNYHRIDGRPFFPEEIIKKIQAMI